MNSAMPSQTGLVLDSIIAIGGTVWRLKAGHWEFNRLEGENAESGVILDSSGLLWSFWNIVRTKTVMLGGFRTTVERLLANN